MVGLNLIETQPVVALLQGEYEKYRYDLAYWLPDYFPDRVIDLTVSYYETYGQVNDLAFYILIRPPYTRQVTCKGELVWSEDCPEWHYTRKR